MAYQTAVTPAGDGQVSLQRKLPWLLLIGPYLSDQVCYVPKVLAVG